MDFFLFLIDNPFYLLLFLIPVILLLSPFWDTIFCTIRNKIKQIQDQRDEKYKCIVRESSDWFREVQRLNNQTKFYMDVVDNGRSVYYVDVDSKAKFDRTAPVEGLYEFLTMHHPKVERALEQVYRNRVIDEAYCKKYTTLHSSASVETCSGTGISFDKFTDLEKRVVREAKLNIVKNYTITCYVKYVSPQGRNRYSKHKVFDESYIHAALKELNRRNAYQATEEYRRKNERSKVTPSLRYDVMKRDGFRCRLCGRSADSGVELEVDHIVPVSKGGSTTYSNLQTLCRDCNRGKGAKV